MVGGEKKNPGNRSPSSLVGPVSFPGKEIAGPLNPPCTRKLLPFPYRQHSPEVLCKQGPRTYPSFFCSFPSVFLARLNSLISISGCFHAICTARSHVAWLKVLSLEFGAKELALEFGSHRPAPRKINRLDCARHNAIIACKSHDALARVPADRPISAWIGFPRWLAAYMRPPDA
jgi:hypothetical protein